MSAIKCYRCGNDQVFTALFSYCIEFGIDEEKLSAQRPMFDISHTYRGVNTLQCVECGAMLYWGGTRYTSDNPDKPAVKLVPKIDFSKIDPKVLAMALAKMKEEE